MLMLEEFLLKLVVLLTQSSMFMLEKALLEQLAHLVQEKIKRDSGTRFSRPVFSWIFSILVLNFKAKTI
jgi:hypothetical protein